MSSSTKNPNFGTQRQGPETLRALRDTLIEELRIHQGADEASEGSASSHRDEAVEDFHDSPGITAAEPPMDLAHPESDLLSGASTGDSSNLTAVAPTIAIALRHANSSRSEVTGDNDRGQTLEESSSDLSSQQACSPGDRVSADAPSFARVGRPPGLAAARQIFRTAVGGLIIITIIGIAVALLSFGQDRRWDRTLGWVSSVFPVATGPSAEPHHQPEATLSDFASMQRQLNAVAERQEQMARELASRQDQLDKTMNDLTGARRQINELAGKEDQMTRALASRQGQLEKTVNDFAVARRQTDEIVAKQEQMAGSIAARQEQLKTTGNDVAAVRRQANELAAKQEQMAVTIATRQDQLKTLVNDFVSIRGQLERLAAKQDQMAGASATPQDQINAMMSEVADTRRQLEQLSAKQDQMADEITRLQAAERNLSQRFRRSRGPRTGTIR